MYALTREENERLPSPADSVYEDSEKFPVGIAVFHQLHVSSCVHSNR